MDAPINNTFPFEIYQSHIFPYLDTKSSIKCESVCKCWNQSMNKSLEKIKGKIELFNRELGFLHCYAPTLKPDYHYSKLSGVVGGWKKFKQLPLITLASFPKSFEHLFRNQSFLELKDMNEPLMRGTDAFEIPFLAALVDETYDGIQKQSIMIIYELRDQILCHYVGRLNFCNSIDKNGTYKSNITEQHYEKIFNLLNGNTINAQIQLQNIDRQIQIEGSAALAKDGFKIP